MSGPRWSGTGIRKRPPRFETSSKPASSAMGVTQKDWTFWPTAPVSCASSPRSSQRRGLNKFGVRYTSNCVLWFGNFEHPHSALSDCFCEDFYDSAFLWLADENAALAKNLNLGSPRRRGCDRSTVGRERAA